MKNYTNFLYRKKLENLPFLAIAFSWSSMFFSFKVGMYIGIIGLAMLPLFFYISVREYDKFDYIRHEKALKGDVCLPLVIEAVTKGRNYTILYSSIFIDNKKYSVVDRYRNWDLVSTLKMGDTAYLKYLSDKPNVFVITRDSTSHE